MQKIIPVLKECPLCEADHHKTFKAVGKLKTFPLVIVYHCDRCKNHYRYDVLNDTFKIIEKPSNDEAIFFNNSFRPDSRVNNNVSKFVAVCKFVYPRFPACKSKCRDSGTVCCPFF